MRDLADAVLYGVIVVLGVAVVIALLPYHLRSAPFQVYPLHTLWILFVWTTIGFWTGRRNRNA